MMEDQRLPPKKYRAAVGQLKKYVDIMTEGGFPCAVVYATQCGLLQTHGSRVLVETFKKTEMELLASEDWNSEEVEQETVIQSNTAIPYFSKPLDKMSLHDLRSLIPQLMTSIHGMGNAGWGKEDKKPAWWPQDIPFVNIKQKPQWYAGSWKEALVRIAKACLSHHGFDPDIHHIHAQAVAKEHQDVQIHLPKGSGCNIAEQGLQILQGTGQTGSQLSGLPTQEHWQTSVQQSDIQEHNDQHIYPTEDNVIILEASSEDFEFMSSHGLTGSSRIIGELSVENGLRLSPQQATSHHAVPLPCRGSLVDYSSSEDEGDEAATSTPVVLVMECSGADVQRPTQQILQETAAAPLRVISCVRNNHNSKGVRRRKKFAKTFRQAKRIPGRIRQPVKLFARVSDK